MVNSEEDPPNDSKAANNAPWRITIVSTRASQRVSHLHSLLESVTLPSDNITDSFTEAPCRGPLSTGEMDAEARQSSSHT